MDSGWKPSARVVRGGRGRRGLTVVEMLIAISVFLISVVSAFTSQITSLGLMSTSRETNVAVTELQAAMEELLVEQLQQIPAQFPAGQPIARFSDLHLQDERIVPSYPGFGGGADVPNPLPIVLTINWTDYGGRPRAMSLASMKSR